MAEATINARIPEELKRHGGHVLAQAGIGPTELIRKAYEYMEREQKLPDFALDKSANPAAQRREALSAFAGCIHLPQGETPESLHTERRNERYGEFWK